MERRDFLKYLSISGLTLSGANILNIGCESGTDAGNTQRNNQAQVDIVTQAADFEAKAIQTYNAVVATGLLTDPSVIVTANDFTLHHETHLAECNKLLLSFGKNEVDASSASPDPGVFNAANQDEILVLASEVEFQAAIFYFAKIVNEVQDNNVRKAFANILPIEVAHMIAYKNVLGKTPAINGGLFELLTTG